MKKNTLIIFSFIGLLSAVCCFIMFLYSIKEENKKQIITQEKIIRCALEEAYFNGQKDAIEGNIIIKKVSANTYIWIGTPWDDGTIATYQPK